MAHFRGFFFLRWAKLARSQLLAFFMPVGMVIFSLFYFAISSNFFPDIPINAYIFCLLIHLNRHWSNMHLWTGLVSCLALPGFFFVPESPRWLASNNKKEEAETIFKQIAKTNGKELGEKDEKVIKDILNEVSI